MMYCKGRYISPSLHDMIRIVVVVHMGWRSAPKGCVTTLCMSTTLVRAAKYNIQNSMINEMGTHRNTYSTPYTHAYMAATHD